MDFVTLIYVLLSSIALAGMLYVMIAFLATFLYRKMTKYQNSLRLFWIVFGIIIAVRLLFIATYPLNSLGGDSQNYYQMIVDGQANLVHASGYPFLFYIGTWLPIEVLLDRTTLGYQYLVLILQHGVDIVGVIVLYFTVRSIFTDRVGAIAALVYGLDFFNMAWSSSVYPEFLQASLLIFSLSAAYFAFRATRFRTALVLYTLAGFFFVWCVFVKFNAFVLFPFLVLLLLFDKSSLRQKSYYVLGQIIIIALSYMLFSRGYMLSSTGTHHLTADKGWVLMSNIDWFWDFELDPDNGIATKRWLALSSVLPNEYLLIAGPGMFAHVDAVSPEIRAPYREQFGYLLDADEAELDEVLANNALPENFQLNYSALPIGYYIGLSDSEQIATGVYAETLLANWQRIPSIMSEAVWIRLTNSDSRDLSGSLELPTRQQISEQYQPINEPFLGFQEYQYALDVPPIFPITYGTPRPIFWEPGVLLYERLYPVFFSSLLFSLFIVINSGYFAVQIIRNRQFTIAYVMPIILGVAYIGFIMTSNAALFFRDKELRLVTSFLAIQAAITFGIVLPQVVTYILHKLKTSPSSNERLAQPR